jgi:hypothetical protein
MVGRNKKNVIQLKPFKYIFTHIISTHDVQNGISVVATSVTNGCITNKVNQQQGKSCYNPTIYIYIVFFK